MGDFFRVYANKDGSATLERTNSDQSSVDQPVIFLETDPTGTGVTQATFPPQLSNVSMGSLKNGMYFNLAAIISLTTNLPLTKSTLIGQDVSFPVVATGGTAPLTYKWYWNNILIDPAINPSAETATLVNHAVEVASSGDYWCVITDADGHSFASDKCSLLVS